MRDHELHTLMATAGDDCRLEFNDPVIEVFHDVPGPVARIAAGAAVFRLQVAAAGLGLASRYGVAMSPDRPGLLARVVVERTGHVDPVLVRLAQSPPDRMDLREAALAEGVRLTWTADDPMVVVLSTEGDTAVEAVAAGLALERVRLAATAYGLSPTFCDEPPVGLVDTGRPQVMIDVADQMVPGRARRRLSGARYSVLPWLSGSVWDRPGGWRSGRRGSPSAGRRDGWIPGICGG